MSSRSKIALVIGAALGAGAAYLLIDVFRGGESDSQVAAAPTVRADTSKLTSEYCITCHEEQGKAWRASNHHLANRTFDPAAPLAEFNGQTVETHSTNYLFTKAADGSPVIEATVQGKATELLHPAMVIAHEPLRQMLIETRPGNFQAMEVAWDPEKREWFDVFGGDVRNPGEWGHWTGQGMNWNSMCAHCHMTGYAKGYDETTSLFKSSWVEQGIGCIQCHGPMEGHEKDESLRTESITRDPQLAMQACAACHARAEQLTTAFQPGDQFNDHFRLQMMNDGRIYHPDGQILDEDFEWGSFVHSRMYAAGVSCLDCHDSHTGATRLPATDNNLCMQCHLPGNTRGAPVIDQTRHSFHPAGSTGASCVACHMSTTVYMQRDPRHDHGFIIPDPVLGLEIGTPDACTKCHSDQTQQWSADAWRKWYGPSDRTQELRERARAVARAQRGDATVAPDLLKLAESEKVSAWRASLLTLASQLAPASPEVIEAATHMRSDSDPLVRSASVQALATVPDAVALVREALADPVRLVRLDAAIALSPGLQPDSPERIELDAYLNASIEGPVARLRRGQVRFQRGEQEAGIADVRRAIELDSLSSAMPEALGMMLNARGDSRAAAEQFEIAAKLAPTDAAPTYFAALAWAEAGDIKRAETFFGQTVRRDPRQSRAWYNLGLLLNQTGRIEDALRALQQAEATGPQDPDAPYAAATILARTGRRAEAVEATRRALSIDPNYRPALELLSALGAAGSR